MGCSRKIPNKEEGSWGYIYFSENPPGIFRFVTLYLKKVSRKQAFTPRNSAKLCDTTKKFQGQKPGPMEISHDFFLNTPGNSAFFFVDAWNFHMLTSMPLEIPCPQHAVLIFSGIAHYLAFVDQNKNWAKHLKHYLEV